MVLMPVGNSATRAGAEELAYRGPPLRQQSHLTLIELCRDPVPGAGLLQRLGPGLLELVRAQTSMVDGGPPRRRAARVRHLMSVAGPIR